MCHILSEWKCTPSTSIKTLCVCFVQYGVRLNCRYNVVQLCYQFSVPHLSYIVSFSHKSTKKCIQIRWSFLVSPSLGYQISYRLDSRDPQRWTTVEVGSNARQFTVTGLSPEQTYVFRLIARTAVGWGEQQEALVVTTERRGKGRTRTPEQCPRLIFLRLDRSRFSTNI